MSKRENDTTANLKSSLWNKIIISLFLSTIVFVFALVLALFVYKQFSFSGYELVYILAQIFKQYLPSWFVVFWLIVIIIVLELNRKKTLKYIDFMADASRQLVSADDELIHLPDELREVENPIYLK